MHRHGGAQGGAQARATGSVRNGRMRMGRSLVPMLPSDVSCRLFGSSSSMARPSPGEPTARPPPHACKNWNPATGQEGPVLSRAERQCHRQADACCCKQGTSSAHAQMSMRVPKHHEARACSSSILRCMKSTILASSRIRRCISSRSRRTNESARLLRCSSSSLSTYCLIAGQSHVISTPEVASGIASDRAAGAGADRASKIKYGPETPWRVGASVST